MVRLHVWPDFMMDGVDSIYTSIVESGAASHPHLQTSIELTPAPDITARQVDAEAAAMSSADGTVVAFDAASVYKGTSPSLL